MNSAVKAEVVYSIAGQQLTQTADFAPGQTNLKILVPDITTASELAITIKSKQGDIVLTYMQDGTLSAPFPLGDFKKAG